MKAVVFHGVGDIRIDDVPEPKIQEPTDAIVRLTASAICGTDLHFIRGTFSGMRPGTILGHEGVGIIEEVGQDVRNFSPGDRVVIASTIACGTCSYCRASYFSQCDRANPNGAQAGTAYFGGPQMTGSFHGLQAEYARIPFAHVGLIKLPDEVDDDQAIMISDIFPSGYFGADLAEIEPGDTVAIFGCGPVGQFTIASAKLHDAGRVLAVDCVPSRLEMAREQGAEIIDFTQEDPVDAIHRLTAGIGVDRAIDAVGIDAQAPEQGPAVAAIEKLQSHFKQGLEDITEQGQTAWNAGTAPSLVLYWAVESLAKAGTLAIIGNYPPQAWSFPIGMAMNKNLTLQMGNCPHRRYIPDLVELVRSGTIDPTQILTQTEPLTGAIEAYKAFDAHQPGWVKVELDLAMSGAPA